MITVYVIESIADQTWYTGMAKDAEKRLTEHNAGKNRFTKGHRPWKIIFTEHHPDWSAARKREKYLKASSGKKWLRKYLEENGGDTGSLPSASKRTGYNKGFDLFKVFFFFTPCPTPPLERDNQHPGWLYDWHRPVLTGCCYSAN